MAAEGHGAGTDLSTRLVHAGEPRDGVSGAVAMPVFQSATYRFGSPDRPDEPLRYVRLNNTPNHDALAAKLADVEQAEDAVVTASGMAAISAALLSVLKPGDHLLVQDTLYGGTHGLVHHDLAGLGVEVEVIDAAEPSSWRAALRETTRAIYVEAIANPRMDVADLPAVAAFAREHELVSMVDATFATPVLARPCTLGFDLTLHSATKYLNGHSDVVAGVAVGSGPRVEAVRRKLEHLGGTLDPHACVLLHRGLKTLELRVRRQCETALDVAAALASHGAVGAVHYPGLPSFRHHRLATRVLDGGFGGMLSVELAGGAAAVDRFLGALEIAIVAPSLGGVETLVSVPARTSHAKLSADERRAARIPDGLVRLSIGIEGAGDLIGDFERALRAR